jgi:hypothetical protein
MVVVAVVVVVVVVCLLLGQFIILFDIDGLGVVFGGQDVVILFAIVCFSCDLVVILFLMFVMLFYCKCIPNTCSVSV